jgi:YHS domain-containing protein
MHFKILLASLLFVLFTSATTAQNHAIYQKNGLALDGYDPVAYFTEGNPTKGSAAFSHLWNDTQWHFSSQANLEAFKANPEQYAPQYGGFCAYGVSEDHKSPTDPNAWTLVDGKLYLNYSPKVKTLWSKDIPGRIQKANQLWPSLTHQKP